eukprot:PhF_6_TR4240/c0_g1_i1/m.5734
MDESDLLDFITLRGKIVSFKQDIINSQKRKIPAYCSRVLIHHLNQVIVRAVFVIDKKNNPDAHFSQHFSCFASPAFHEKEIVDEALTRSLLEMWSIFGPVVLTKEKVTKHFLGEVGLTIREYLEKLTQYGSSLFPEIGAVPRVLFPPLTPGEAADPYIAGKHHIFTSLVRNTDDFVVFTLLLPNYDEGIGTIPAPDTMLNPSLFGTNGVTRNMFLNTFEVLMDWNWSRWCDFVKCVNEFIRQPAGKLHSLSESTAEVKTRLEKAKEVQPLVISAITHEGLRHGMD